MKRKIFCILVWIMISIIYIAWYRDVGRSVGAQTKSAYEAYTEAYTQNYVGVEGVAQAVVDGWSYNTFHDLEKNTKNNYTELGVINVVYAGLSLVIYHIWKKEDYIR